MDGEEVLRVGLQTNNTETQRNMLSSKIGAMSGHAPMARNQSEWTINASSHDMKVWYNGNDIGSSEAICLTLLNRSRCTTRIIPEAPSLNSTNERPNILLLLIDPISRGFFERSMPLTRQKLRELEFVHFSKFTAVGANSGPNQAALYSGIPLTRRDGINKNSERRWLWDRLRQSGYKTLKAEDGCIENSNMVQSLKPNTTHGEALNRLFCFDFDRPNCVGPDLASRHLLNYGEQFVKAYQGVAPWAAFLHFVDTHEDTMILSSSLDSQVPSFLEGLHRDMRFENTVVVLCSDHGLHYGPYFQARSGRKERSQPLLYIRIPSSLEPRIDMEAFTENSQLWTTAFDLHETMIQLTSKSKIDNKHHQKFSGGKSLFEALPSTRGCCDDTTDIPSEYCTIAKTESSNQCVRIPNPPSLLSFLADIPLSNRPNFKAICTGLRESTPSEPSLLKVCECATSHRDWHMCTGHPWGINGVLSQDFPEEHFALMKCRGEKPSIDTRIIKQHELLSAVSRSRGKALKPNILLIEVDSVSTAYADRHFPLTRNFLKAHKPRRSTKGEARCDGEICAVDFNLVGLLGANSIANEIPVLSGCMVTRFHSDCFETSGKKDLCSEVGMFTARGGKGCQMCPSGTFLKDPLSPCFDSASICCTRNFEGSNRTKVCSSSSRREHGLQLFRRDRQGDAVWCPFGDGSPFLFDVAKERGYLTLFGQEACGDWILGPEKNKFPLHADIDVHKLYCRTKEKFAGQVGEAHLNQQCSRQRFSIGKSINPLMDHVRGMWDAYPEHTKFAYIMHEVAFHEPGQDWTKMVARSEAYDLQLLEFLLEILERGGRSDTVIILRSNNGLHDGPTTPEYSVQVEHRDPWTQVIFPQMSNWVSIQTAVENQDRLVNGFDLYRTIRDLMGGTGVLEATPDPATPGRSYNILNSLIPEGRTCVDAKIPVDFCPCEGEVERPPSYGVCDPFDPYSDLFCLGD